MFLYWKYQYWGPIEELRYNGSKAVSAAASAPAYRCVACYPRSHRGKESDGNSLMTIVVEQNLRRAKVWVEMIASVLARRVFDH